MANRLANASSAYLKSAAHQPIDWHEFGEEAFQLAREQDKPILLDIGAVWCHWCHVIDRESYDDPDIAALINRHYIAVKVDRDQRPDVDARYQQVVQSMSGQGGWPLTAFLTYDGRLIYGGTYFPPATMKTLLNRVQETYRERKNEIFKHNEVLNEENIRVLEQNQAQTQRAEAAAEEISPSALRQLCRSFTDAAITTARRSFDTRNGGFGGQPKFPHFSTLELLMARAHHDGDHAELMGIIEKTLTEMARGGMYDQIAGGFHRYSVDDHWHVPHFEKMAYDNAEALKVYAQAYRLTGIPFFREIAEGVIGWVNAQLSDQQHGGFYASQDADIDLNDDGDHFTWSPDELAEILDPGEVEVVNRYYDLSEAGDMHHAKGRNALYVSRPLTGVAHELSIPLADAEAALASAQAKMREKRRQRPMPFIDATLYVNWNGMMIAAYFEAADLLDLPDVRDFAEKSLERMLGLFYERGHKVHHATGVDGFLEDYAWLSLAALKGYQSTGNVYYLDVCRDIADLMLRDFEDAREDSRLGGFNDTANRDHALGLLNFKRKPVEDSPSSSANAVALLVLEGLHAITEDSRYSESLERGLNLLIHLHGNYGLFVSALALAAQFYEEPPLKLEITGAAHELKAAARQVFFPGKLITYVPEAPQAEVRVCVGTRCVAPARNPHDLAAQIRTLHAPSTPA
ncbi:MAG TPA: thioredoxin domain-containing protein [Coleofasciculaceae cyanobacterium]|jgi:hypothetical protein